MGKRELLIIVGFVVIGVVAYQLTAPPAKEGEGFSISRIWRNTRRSVRGNAPIASHTATGTIAVGASVKQLRLMGLNRGIRITGERRADIAYELTVASSGPDEATALAWAKETRVVEDEVGEDLGLRVTYSDDGSQYGSIVLRVPARLAVRVDGSVGSAPGGTGGAHVSGVAGIELDATGSVTIESISGAVAGSHTNGELTLAGAATVNLRLDGSRARFTKVAQSLTLTARQTRCEISDSTGSVDVSGNGVTTTIRQHAGPIRVAGSGGRVTIDGPGDETRIDVRRTEVQVTLRTPATMTILTSDQPMRLLLAGPPAITIDAVATDAGTITATEFGLSPETRSGESRLEHTFAGASPRRVTIRNQRGNIVIGQAK